MKKPLLALMLLTAPLAFTGCGTPEATAYKATAITVTTVDGAMNGWGDYVRAGKATAAEQASVRLVYDKYRTALIIERDVVRANAANPGADAVTLANQSLAAASGDLISLIADLTKGTK